jgi:hypothetical protein
LVLVQPTLVALFTITTEMVTLILVLVVAQRRNPVVDNLVVVVVVVTQYHMGQTSSAVQVAPVLVGL